MAGSDKTESRGNLREMGVPEEESETGSRGWKSGNTAPDPNVPREKGGTGIVLRKFGPPWNQKWKVISIMLLLGLFFIMGTTPVARWREMVKAKMGAPIRDTVSRECLKEESLSPFFIPLSGEKNRQVARVDLSVIWPGPASVKYRKNELRIRDQFFSRLKSLTRENNDSDNGPEALADNLTVILQNSLGIHNLKVRVREINYF